MRMESYEKFIVRLGTLFMQCTNCQQSQEQIQIRVFEYHLMINISSNYSQNNFNSMESPHLLQSPPIRKISNSTIQFRQLIQSLRKQNQHTPVPQSEGYHEENTVKEQEHQQTSTLINSEPNPSQNNNFIAPTTNPSQSRLQSKPRMEVGDRDKLKKKRHNLDNNPEIEQPLTKDKSQQKFEVSRIEPITSSKQFIQLGVSPKKNVSTQCQGFHLSETSSMFSPRNNQRTGHIRKQVVKDEKKCEPELPFSSNKIRDINEKIVIQYLQKQMKVNQKSDPSEIFNFFINLCLSCDVIIKNPSIKKYKNCVYFGHKIDKESFYEGFLYFYDNKIYYGEFLNGFKHGLGVEINMNDNVISKGEFKDGHKTGKFYIEKPKEKYIGYLENGLYQGQGRLTTEDYVYEGLFDQGQKNGYGQEFYPKTGIKISGTFVNGVLQKGRNAKSIPEIRSKAKVTISKTKQKSKQRLEHIRKKSLQKHNHRMNKIRSTSRRQSQYEIQFDNQQYNEPSTSNKLQVNSSKLQMYRQPVYKLPKICQEFEYSFEQGKNFESISSHNEPHVKFHTPHRRDFMNGGPHERMGTGQFQQPLPTPCLTVYKRHR